MKVSVCITIFNESEITVRRLLAELKSQTLKPDEIIIIDAKDYDNCSRSRGRNIAIEKAKNEIIAITDAGCVPHKDWLENVTKPFKIASSQVPRNDTVVAGGYKMIARNSFEKAESIFLGTRQTDIKENFMPSARSMALTKSIWKKAGGFPEELRNTAEDTVFNIKLLKVGAKFAVSKNAIVDWYMPETLIEFARKIYNYAKGDAESGIWWHPVKRLKTHNIKLLLIMIRYVIGCWLLVFSFKNPIYSLHLYILISLYLLYAYKKAKLWGIILQFTSDFACIIGFSHGILSNCFKWT